MRPIPLAPSIGQNGRKDDHTRQGRRVLSAFDTLLSSFEVSVEPFAICDLRDDWRMTLEGEGALTVHYGLSGVGTVQIGGGQPVPVGPDTIIIVPPGLSQQIAAPGARRTCPRAQAGCVTVAEGLERLTAGNGPRRVLMACGRVRASYGESTGVFDLLAEPIVEMFGPDHTVHHAFRALLAELSNPGLGSKAMAEALMRQCLIATLRRLAERNDARLPWLLAMVSAPRLAAAMDAMVTHPERSHSIEDLAALAGMSRTAFCSHFTQAFGRPPHGFLSENRLRRAARFLATTDLPVKAIAAKIGYRSRSHFSRAFKALYGTDPNTYRQTSERDGRQETPLL